MRNWIAFLVLFLAFLSPAWSLDSTAAMRRATSAFHDGDFLQAVTLARRAGTAEAYAFAARAKLVHADFVSPQGQRLPLVMEAEQDARRAIALDPAFSEGHLQLAIALGFRGRLEGHMAAHFEGLADEARRHLDFVIDLEPENPWAHALLGGWHLEISEAGGLLGRTIYGANVASGIAEYARALELAPGDLVVTLQCALQLTALEREEHRARAVELLSAASLPEEPDALQVLTLARLRKLEAALARGNEEEIERVVLALKGMNDADAAR